MVITKHYAVHGKKYRRQLIKYILDPKKTRNLSLISDFGMSNYLDFPDYVELVKMYQNNFLSNDQLYDSRFDRQEKKQQKIHAHHIIQSFSSEDKLSPEEINRIGYETIKELIGGQYKFIVATHVDQDHCHNHIIINSINSQSQKKLKWDYALERNLQMISDRISKVAGAKIIPPKRYSHRDYEVYRRSNHKYELKQRLFFLMEHSIDFNDFMQKAEQLNVKIDFSRKHSRFFMTDRNMKQVIQGDKLNKREPYSKEYFQRYFAKKKIELILELDFLRNKIWYNSSMNYEASKQLTDVRFKRLVGVQRTTFEEMLAVLKTAYQRKHAKGGRTPKLSLEDLLMATLQYMREYRTYEQIAADFGIHESNLIRRSQWVESTLIQSGFTISKTHLSAEDTVIVDATEVKINRPKKIN